MEPVKRLEICLIPFIGFGIFWDSYAFPLHLSILFPFVGISIGIGRYETTETRPESKELA